MPPFLDPWPIENLLECLSRGDALRTLVAPKNPTAGRNVREDALEQLLEAVCKERFGPESVSARKPLASTLELRSTAFPARCLPDLAVRHDGRIHICEVKSSRVDYARFDNVFDSKGFREHLAARGHRGVAPWEVEQDLIKLRLFGDLSKEVGTCLLLFVDGFAGPGRSWTSAFRDPNALRAVLRTELAKGWAEELIASTRILPVKVGDGEARVIACLAYRAR
jgi:hypothetical protein